MDYEFLMESEKLKETLNILDKEILNYIAKRKYITEYIVDYRKNYIEEYKDDEDKLIDYFDHENYVKEEAFKTIDKRLKEFTILKESPYFGKITFNEQEAGVEEIYIGRFGLTPEETYEPVIVDWRAPVASLFYKGTLGKAQYKSPDGDIQTNIIARRQLIVKKGELKGLFDSEVDVKDEILQMVLTSNSSSSLKDIVMTIQQEQDEIIRAPRNKAVVVNGVAGSGKTTIALHRVSYLLYNFRKELGDKVLILGPNNIFIDYIAQVLPTLGEVGVNQTTFENFAINEIGINEPIKYFSEYIEEAMNGDEEALTEYKYKSSEKFVEELDNIINIMNEDYFHIEEIVFFSEVIVGTEEINELFTKYYGYMPLFRRSEKIRRVLTAKIKDKRDELVRKLNLEYQNRIQSLSKEELEIERVNLEFKRRIRIREIVREVINARECLDRWLKHEDIISLYKRITDTKHLGYMDLAGILYLMIVLDGKKSNKIVKHLVIDEAQDYSFIQFKVLKAITGCNNFTIVGDSNQRLIKTDEEPAMLQISKIFEKNHVIEYKLNKSYRSTQEIMEYSNKFLKEDNIVPLVRHGEQVIEEITKSKEDTVRTLRSILEDYEEEGLENIAIIVNNKASMDELSCELNSKNKIIKFDNEDMLYNGGKVLIPAYYAKGLEFDGVIIFDNSNKVSELVKYIMCTRALHRLAIISEA